MLLSLLLLFDFLWDKTLCCCRCCCCSTFFGIKHCVVVVVVVGWVELLLQLFSPVIFLGIFFTHLGGWADSGWLSQSFRAVYNNLDTA